MKSTTGDYYNVLSNPSSIIRYYRSNLIEVTAKSFYRDDYQMVVENSLQIDVDWQEIWPYLACWDILNI